MHCYKYNFQPDPQCQLQQDCYVCLLRNVDIFLRDAKTRLAYS
jgi:hypothetical protein